MKELDIGYSLWKDVVNSNSFTVYYQAQPRRGFVYAGTDLYLYTARIDSDAEFATLETDFPTRTVVESRDEAIARIVGLSSVRAGTFDADGHTVIATAFVDSGGYDGVYLGFRWEVTAGSTDIYDYDLQHNVKIQGGYRTVLGNPVDGDYLEMSAVDKDNFTGMFDGTNPNGMNPDGINLGLTVGTDVLELFKFIRDEQIDPTDHGQRFEYLFASAKFVPAGIYLRSKYHSNGSQDVVVKAAYRCYEE